MCWSQTRTCCSRRAGGGVNPPLVNQIADRIRSSTDLEDVSSSSTISGFVMDLCVTVTVLDQGMSSAKAPGTPEEVRCDPAVLDGVCRLALRKTSDEVWKALVRSR